MSARAGVLVAPSSRGWRSFWRSAVFWALPAVTLVAVLVGGAAGAGAASTTVTEKNNPTFGTILADSAGATLYTLTNNGQPVLCTGICAQVWPPLTVPPGTTVTGPPGVCCLGSTTNANGDAVTYKGDPLYRYVNDSSPSDATGDGVNSFGGTWHVVRVTASTTTTTTTAPSPTTATTAPPTSPPATTAGSAAGSATGSAAAGTAASSPASSAAAVPLGSPGTGGTPPRIAGIGVPVGIGAVLLGLAFAAKARRNAQARRKR
ncbi:MAG TPA: hypothetical protein VFZ97_07445 [Acidimicrobiales bacterium]